VECDVLSQADESQNWVSKMETTEETKKLEICTQPTQYHRLRKVGNYAHRGDRFTFIAAQCAGSKDLVIVGEATLSATADLPATPARLANCVTWYFVSTCRLGENPLQIVVITW